MSHDSLQNILTLVIVVCAAFCNSIQGDEEACIEEVANCYCKLNNNRVIDLSLLKKGGDFISFKSSDNLTYFYHPCSNLHLDVKKLNLVVSNDTISNCDQTSVLNKNKIG